MSVHYKFKSNLNCDTVTFDGLHISIADLKKSIMQQKKIGKSSDFNLQITNAQTAEVYDNDETLVPKNTSVIVARIPVVSSNKKTWEKPELPLPLDDGDKSGHIRFDKLVKSADIANTNATEDDKVKAMITQSSQEYDPSKYVKSRSMTGPLPPEYTCYRCGKQGHWIKNCPTNNLDIKRSTGIPRSFMVPVDGPEHKGALLTSSGDYAVPIIDHHAYKEVKKEKPPFVNEPEVAPEPEAEIPEELLCMFCKSLLQEAVLIPCCGNSFCDECVRQALLDSDNHECPICHEIDISPDTVIPNRFLRTAVLNFKNETGYTRVKKLFPTVTVPAPHIESPQPSPDSTVENQPVPDDNIPLDIKDESEPVKEEPVLIIKEEGLDEDLDLKLPKEETPEPIDDATPPGTPLADEPTDDVSETLPIQRVSLEEYDDYHPAPYRRHRYRDDYDNDSHDDDSEPRQISTIETITNVRKRFGGRPLPMMQSQHHQHYTNAPQNRERQNDYEQRGRDFHGRYDRRNHNERPPMRGHRAHRYDMTQNDRYRHQDNQRDYMDYNVEPRHMREPRYDTHASSLESRRPVRYVSPPHSTVVAPTIPVPAVMPAQIDVTPQYKVPAAVVAAPPLPALLPSPVQTPSFPPQPPPPGASPIDHSSHIPPQPPPPGVGPLPSVPLLPDPPSAFPGRPFKSEEIKPKTEERSIDDRMEAFQRELDKRASESVRDRASRSSSRSRKRSRSTTRSSHSRSYSTSKSWSRNSSRSLSRSSRSRSRTSYSSRSRSRSYSRSRSRSRSKSRSYSRSRSRSPDARQRSKSRSRSRERDREKRRGNSRDRPHINYSKNHSPSLSPPTRNYHPRDRHSPYPARRPYNPPLQYGGGSYTAPYTAPTSLMPVPVLRTAQYVPTHLHSNHPVQSQPVTHSHPIEHYPVERTRYPYNNLAYAGYDVYQHPTKPYGHQRYERENRTQRFESSEYQREYPRREEEVQQRIVGWVGDRGRDYQQRFRPMRDQQRKEIKELPKVPEPELKSEIRVRETKEKQDYVSKKRDDTCSRRKEETNSKKKDEASTKKKEEKVSTKHKKHHHHHRTKDSKKSEKQECKIPVVVSADSTQHPSATLISVPVVPEMGVELRKVKEEEVSKPVEKVKEKKHKHKKHKSEEHVAKKKKNPKKVKTEATDNPEASGKIKTKKKKSKVKAILKALEETKKKEKSGSKHPKKIKVEKMEEPVIPKEEKIEDPDVLTLTAEDLKLESENPDTYNECPDDVIKLHTSTEDFELEFDMTEEKSTIDETVEQQTVPDEVESKSIENPIDSEIDAPADSEIADGTNPLEETANEEAQTDYEADALQEEEEEEEEDENELHVEVPELSKWEREDFDDEVISRPQRRSAIVIPKDVKATLSSDIIQRAEKVIMQKPLKTAIVLSSSSTGKEKIKSEKKSSSKSVSPEDSTGLSHPELKSTIDRARSPSLQVTISTNKDKRSVLAKDEAQQQSLQTRRIKLDRSSFKSIEPPNTSSHRTVIIEEPLVKKFNDKPQRKVESRTVITKREHPKIHGPDYKSDNDNKSSSRGERESYKAGSDRKHDYDKSSQHSLSREDSSRKKDGFSNERQSTKEDSDFHRTQKDVRKTGADHDRSQRSTITRSSRFDAPSKESHKRRSRSQSSDTTESLHSSSKRQHISVDTKKHDSRQQSRYPDNNESHHKAKSPHSSSPTRHQKKSQNKKQSVVKMATTSTARSEKCSRLDSRHDESKFEPDYDEFSDNDPHQSTREKGKLKRAPETQESNGTSHKRSKTSDHESRQQRKVEKRKTVSSSSSASSSSSPSESEESSDERNVRHKSVDAEHKRHKKSKHKKHKKHKHRKKKSHKSKLRS